MSVKPSTETAFAKKWAQNFEEGKSDFDGISRYFLSLIRDGCTPEDKRLIYTAALKSAVEGQKIYYKSTFCGKIEKVFYNIAEKIFRFQTNYHIAKEEVRNSVSSEKVIKQSNILMTGYFGVNELSNLMISTSSSAFIGNSDGVVFETTEKGQTGGARRCSPCTCYGLSDEPREMGILMPKIMPMPLERREYFQKESWSLQIEQYDAVLAATHEAMKKEYVLLGVFEELGIAGVIKMHDHFSVSVNGCDVGCTLLDFHRKGSLIDLMRSSEFKDFKREDKQKLIAALLKIYAQIHKNGYILRDIKPGNIVIGKENQPIGIDFELCILAGDENNRLAGTPPYLPPENIVNLLASIPTYNTIHGDIWALGLVLFQVAFGEILIERFVDNKPTNNEFMKKAAGVYQSTFPAFLEAMDYATCSNPELQSIHGKIQQNRELWNQIIKPMLSIDPKDRPSLSVLNQRMESSAAYTEIT